MRNPLFRARSRRSDEAVDPADSAETGDRSGTEPDQAAGWAAFAPDAADAAAGDPKISQEGAVTGGAPTGSDDAAGTCEPTGAPEPDEDEGGPARSGRVGRLLGATNRAYLVVVAVALLLGPGAGASARAHLAAAIPRPKAAAVTTSNDEVDDEVDDGVGTGGAAEEAPTIDDGRRRYLVALAPSASAATTTAPVTGGPTATSTTTTTHAATHTTAHESAPVAQPPGPPATLPPAPFPVTVLPGEETQWVDVVRVDGSRVAVLLPVRYLQLVRENDPGHAAHPVAAGRALVRDRDGRYWSAARDGMDPTLLELPGQLPPPTATAAGATTSRTTAASAAHGTSGHEAAGAEAAGAEPASTVHRTSTLPTIARSTTTTLPPAPAALVEPVPLADRDLAIALASLPGVDEVKALGPGVFAVIGTVDPADLRAVVGVASVRQDTLWSSSRVGA